MFHVRGYHALFLEGSQLLCVLGDQKGDRVMLVLKRHYQFWFAIAALHKIGAVAVPRPTF
jgi:acyl-coenzyme A synthetase/AMP-(fatty) acid ligase